uniref:Uncharacterized protein n=1 Tax=Melopsittacus undulatus TaxID=13146 RepID=A0A8V5FS08_MELUD
MKLLTHSLMLYKTVTSYSLGNSSIDHVREKMLISKMLKTDTAIKQIFGQEMIGKFLKAKVLLHSKNFLSIEERSKTNRMTTPRAN